MVGPVIEDLRKRQQTGLNGLPSRRRTICGFRLRQQVRLWRVALHGQVTMAGLAVVGVRDSGDGTFSDFRESVRCGSASRAPATWRIRGSPWASWMPCFRLRRRHADAGAPGLVQLGDRRNRPAEPDNPAEPVDSLAAANRRAGAATTGRPAGRQRRRGGAALHAGRDHGVSAVRGALRGGGPESPGIAAVRRLPPPTGEITCRPAALCPTARRACGANTTWWSWRCSAWDAAAGSLGWHRAPAPPTAALYLNEVYRKLDDVEEYQ